MRDRSSALRISPVRDNTQHLRLLLQAKSLQACDRVFILPFRGDGYGLPTGPVYLFDIRR